VTGSTNIIGIIITKRIHYRPLSIKITCLSVKLKSHPNLRSGDVAVQTAAKRVLEPIFEADLEPNAYGYRPKRSALDAIRTVHELLCKGYTDVVDADLSKYFDTIPHSELMQCVARRIVDRHVLRLIKLWLKVPVENRDKDGRGQMSGGRKSYKGSHQSSSV
jgi:RNA-directed DNA polymerase